MNELCRVTADTNEYHDRIANTPDEVEPTDDLIEKKLCNLVDEAIIDETHNSTGDVVANCGETWGNLTAIKPVESVDRDLTVSQALYLARAANELLKKLNCGFEIELYDTAYKQAKEEANE